MRKKTQQGGYRPGAGRKGEWKSGKTKAVKLPETLVPEILRIARVIDDGQKIQAKIDSVTESKNESVTQSKVVTEAITILNEALTLKPNAGGKIKEQIRLALKLLTNE